MSELSSGPNWLRRIAALTTSNTTPSSGEKLSQLSNPRSVTTSYQKPKS